MVFIRTLIQCAAWLCDQVPFITSMAFTHPGEIAQVPRTAEVHGLRRSTQATGADVAGFQPEAGIGFSTLATQIDGSYVPKTNLRFQIQKPSTLYISH